MFCRSNDVICLSQLYKLKDRMRDILSYVLQVEQKVESVKVNKAKVRGNGNLMTLLVTTL